MRPNPLHASEDPELVRPLIRENPWGTLISHHDGDLIASHYPILLDDEVDGLEVLTHVVGPTRVPARMADAHGDEGVSRSDVVARPRARQLVRGPDGCRLSA
ncbi:MAG: FMN-binding negative transcriptional regulator [Acidimicrobiales bacterium]